MNVLNQKVLTIVFDILQSFMEHLNINQMEVLYFDWPLSCVVWHLLDYINFNEVLNVETITFEQFNQSILTQLVTLITKNSANSIRLRRFENFFLIVLTNSENHLFKNNNFRYLFFIKENLYL